MRNSLPRSSGLGGMKPIGFVSLHRLTVGQQILHSNDGHGTFVRPSSKRVEAPLLLQARLRHQAYPLPTSRPRDQR